MYYDTWITSELCKVLGMTGITSFQVSLFSVFLLSLNQYLVICRGLKNRSQSKKHLWVMLGLCWIIPSVLSLAWINLDHNVIRNSLCLPFPSHSEIATAALSVFLFFDFGLISLMLGLYISILQYVRKSSRHIQRTGTQNTNFMKLKFALSFWGSFSTWLMFSIIALVPLWIENPNPIKYSWLVVLALPLSSILNPVIHTFLSIGFLKKFFRKPSHNRHETSQSMIS